MAVMILQAVPLRPEAEPSVSVVIPCFNYARYLEPAVRSAFAQPGVTLDVTIVDDCSTDTSVEVAARLAGTDNRVHLVQNRTNRGPVETANRALSLATGTYVVKLDADDMLPPGAVSRAVALLEAIPTVSFVYGKVDTFETEPPAVGSERVRSWTVWSGHEWLETRLRRGHNAIRQPEAVMRRSALDEVGGHRQELQASSDMAMWLRLATAGAVGRVNGPVQGWYRIHSASLQRTIHSGLLFDLQERILAFSNLFEERGQCLEDLDRARRVVGRSMALDALRLAERAVDTGRVHDEPVGDYLRIAQLADPRLTTGRRWRALQYRLRWAESHPHLVRAAPGAVARDIENRLRWRYWRRTGL